MQRTTTWTDHAQLAAFLSAHVGKVESGDIGPLLGEAAVLFDSPHAGARTPAHLQQACNLALSEGADMAARRARWSVARRATMRSSTTRRRPA